MSHHPYPNADRALRQVHRGRIRWEQPADSLAPWVLNMRQAFSTLRLPDGFKGPLPNAVMMVGPGRAVADGVSAPVHDATLDATEAHRCGVVRIVQ